MRVHVYMSVHVRACLRCARSVVSGALSQPLWSLLCRQGADGLQHSEGGYRSLWAGQVPDLQLLFLGASAEGPRLPQALSRGAEGRGCAEDRCALSSIQRGQRDLEGPVPPSLPPANSQLGGVGMRDRSEGRRESGSPVKGGWRRDGWSRVGAEPGHTSSDGRTQGSSSRRPAVRGPASIQHMWEEMMPGPLIAVKPHWKGVLGASAGCLGIPARGRAGRGRGRCLQSDPGRTALLRANRRSWLASRGRLDAG